MKRCRAGMNQTEGTARSCASVGRLINTINWTKNVKKKSNKNIIFTELIFEEHEYSS